MPVPDLEFAMRLSVPKYRSSLILIHRPWAPSFRVASPLPVHRAPRLIAMSRLRRLFDLPSPPLVRARRRHGLAVCLPFLLR